MDLLAITAQLYVLNGSVQEMGTVPGLIAQPAPVKAARGRERDFLFAHLTLNGPLEDTAELSSQLVEALAHDFYQSSGSVTASLRRAVIAINERLLQYNLAATPAEKKKTYEGALTCSALHNDELYTLQVGEGLAFLGHQFGVERLPVQMPQHLTPLGRSAGIDIRFAYHRLQSGDMMLLTDPRLAYLTGTTLSPVLVNSEIETGLESLTSLVAGDTARLLLVEFADELPSTLPLTFRHSKQGPPPKRQTPAPVVAGGSTVRAATSMPSPAMEKAPPVIGQTGLPLTDPPINYPAKQPANTVPASLTVETGARRVASSSARGLSRLSNWLALALGRLTTTDQIREENETPVNWLIPTAIALLVPILLAAIVTGVYFQRGNVEQLGALKQQMAEAITNAEEASSDPAAARTQYNAVIALAGEAESLRPGDPEVLRLRNQARDALDRLDGVTSLAAIPFYRYESDTILSRVIQTGDSSAIAVLDQTEGRVLLHQLTAEALNQATGEPATLAFTGQAVGSQIIGNLVDILWLPGGAGAARDNIGILDQSGQLFNYFPNLGDMRGSALDNSSSWVNPTVMNTFMNRLYVLDPGMERIWKYYPQDAGFTQQQDDPFISFSSTMDLAQAVDFDIYSEDGSIIVIYRDGRVRYYDSRSGNVQWDETTLMAGGLTTPFVSPAAVDITGRGLTASIFILDPGSGRLVQLSRGGTVLAQYRILDAAENDVLNQASDFIVEEAPLRVYVVAQNTIYSAGRD